MASTGETSFVELLFNHVVLPPQLPGKADSTIHQVERGLNERLQDCTSTLLELTHANIWGYLDGVLSACKILNAHGKLNSAFLLSRFENLKHGDLLILHISEQNAALLVRRYIDDTGDNVIFEAFEASPLAEKVLETQGALVWDFPGRAVAIPWSGFKNPLFQQELVIFLKQATIEPVKQFAASTYKAGAALSTTRHTADPTLVSKVLMTLLEANGHHVSTGTLRKRVRDEVSWADGAERPWRRCAFWLVLRVGMQRNLCTLYGGETGRIYYKFLMCLFLANLAEEALDHLHPELLSLLKAKLCRRLMKLEVEKNEAPEKSRMIYKSLSTALQKKFEKATLKVSERIESMWESFKTSIQRPIRILQYRANKEDLILTLPNSHSYLDRVLSQLTHEPYRQLQNFQYQSYMRQHTASIKTISFADRYFALALTEAEIESKMSALLFSKEESQHQCEELALTAYSYLKAVGDAYEDNPEQKSIMLLSIMELWVSMDKCAIQSFNLLKDYSPPFSSEILDVLQLPSIHDMCRLQKIQEYLDHRITTCNTKLNIFADPQKGCFAERYFNESPETDKLQALLQAIEAQAEVDRSIKEREWLAASAEYESLIRKSSENSCIYYTNDYEPLRPIHDDRKCPKCCFERWAKRISIQVHEHPLPSDPSTQKAVVFELQCPEAFAAYRDVSWIIFATLGHPQLVTQGTPRVILPEYSELRSFFHSKKSFISLAARQKSVLQTHLAKVHFPIDLEKVCLPNGLRFVYYDTLRKVFPSSLTQRPSFAHHCQMVLPANSAFPTFQSGANFSVDSDGPSSYEIIASQTRCPSGLNSHEFLAYQTLFSGKERRWLTILIELGSSNLNFSTETTSSVVSQLAVQVGPRHNTDDLRVIHKIFRDEIFCKRLLQQLQQRLSSISTNWRETSCMDMLITLITRLSFMTTNSDIKAEADELLRISREITFEWIEKLRTEISQASDPETHRKCSRYALWAALLCKKSFTVYLENDTILQAQSISCFIACSITLQDNMPGDPATLPIALKNAMIRDLRMTYKMRYMLRKAIEANPDIFSSAINFIWPAAPGSTARHSTAIQFLSGEHHWWMESTVDDGYQALHLCYNILNGYLLVNGQPLGKLPAEHKESLILDMLFGKQVLLTYPSSLPGMRYLLAVQVHGHQIHIGLRQGKLFVRAYFSGNVLELIERPVFGNPTNFDLPASLVENCWHWLDIKTGIIQIRSGDPWKPKKSDWQLDFRARKATRRTVTLVDPYSSLFQRVTAIFHKFQDRHHLTVFQPASRNLSVELRRLELNFTVNHHGLLESSELQSEIDPNQDAGTWYGLNSKIVLRSSINPRQRSILVPMGKMTYARNRLHVTVDLAHLDTYGKFTINDVLGRLECAVEPRLLYLKAQLHAYTSFVLPDPLTGRTGSEEALHCLQSGYCQPWKPLGPDPYKSLVEIANLTPKREYYPEGMKVMQKVSWNHSLTTTIQQDDFRKIVDDICRKSENLEMFAFQKTYKLPPLGSSGDHQLIQRSSLRRRKFVRQTGELLESSDVLDALYDARDRCISIEERTNIIESVSLIRTSPPKIYTTADLAAILQKWSNIGGYDQIFDKVLLSDRLSVDLSLEWGCLANTCRKSTAEDKYRLMFLFALISSQHDIDMEIIRTLIAISIIEELRKINPPSWPSYSQFRRNQVPHADYILQLLQSCCVPYSLDDEYALPFRHGPKQHKKLQIARQTYEKNVEKDCKAFADFILSQWPCEGPHLNGLEKTGRIDTDKALSIIVPEWQRLYHNYELSKHIQQVQHVLNLHSCSRQVNPVHITVNDLSVSPVHIQGRELPTLSEMCLSNNEPSSSENSTTKTLISNKVNVLGQIKQNGMPRAGIFDSARVVKGTGKENTSFLSVAPEIQELERIISGIVDSRSNIRKQYALDLNQSLSALKQLSHSEKEHAGFLDPTALSTEIHKHQSDIQKQFGQICESFEKNDSRAHWLKRGGLWPCITPVTLLERLRSTKDITCQLKKSLVSFGVSITALQRLIRLDDALKKGNKQRLLDDQENTGHKNWKPFDYPDWLLLEIDANFLIRPDQVDVANATISPASKENSVLQMNMGQGKTSCIMPMVAVVLADPKNLVRVVVPKPLLLQTAQLMQIRVGGLIGREVSHVPFSRKTPTEKKTIKTFYDLHRHISKSLGVMLVLPEHMLSFKLSARQRMLDDRMLEATQMTKVEAWLQSHSRDILDESDFTLAVRTQLIYPSGPSTMVTGHPHRWTTAETLLGLVEGHLWNLQEEFSRSIEVVRRPQGGFPIIFFLRKDVEDALLQRLVDDICNGRTLIIPTRDCSEPDRQMIKLYISEPKVPQGVTNRIQELFTDNLAAKANIQLVRGLLVHRILLLTLKKRWNVQYGLHPTRDPIAVPYHAKGVPSEQAEWGHPDVAILFTCLAFYYDGVSMNQLKQSLARVLKSDDPAADYDRWTYDSNLAGSLRDWSAINVDDNAQLHEIWQSLRYNRNVVEYYLNNFVFPIHAKQFHLNLQASGWDIPLFSTEKPSSTSKPPSQSKSLTTGFSGTNDNRTMLPLTIKQEDLPALAHTNAEVLTYLLQPRSRTYVLAADHYGRHISEIELLWKICKMNIRILIDAGAQILEMNNRSLAEAWLGVDKEAQAAIYFGEDNRAWVLYRKGHEIPLLATPFADDLSNCLVYLDEAHTRGTDLKLPAYSCGALTLGLGQTKDQTVQAAMRLRQLATTQSVSFFAPPEVHQSILHLRGKDNRSALDSHDVICWLIEQTCEGVEQLQPLYFSQGTEFCRRTQAAVDNPHFLSDVQQRNAYLETLRQKEHRGLKQLYEPKTKSKPLDIIASPCPALQGFIKDLNIRRKGFQDTGNAVHGSALQEVEQEREVAFEVETIREVQKPVHYLPFSFPGLHRDIISFAKTGRLFESSSGYERCFVAIQRTHIGQKYKVRDDSTLSKLFVSFEFSRTVKNLPSRASDVFQRQVNWILWSTITDTALIVVPEEAEQLITLLRFHEISSTHLLTYAAPVTRRMLHFNQLDYYAIPALPVGWKAPDWLMVSLGIFAGRLYFEYGEYNGLCNYLGLEGALEKQIEETTEVLSTQKRVDKVIEGVHEYSSTPEQVDNSTGDQVSASENSDGVYEAKLTASREKKGTCIDKPLTFLQEWLALKRKGQDFAHTPMGYICQGKALMESHPFFSVVKNSRVWMADRENSKMVE